MIEVSEIQERKKFAAALLASEPMKFTERSFIPNDDGLFNGVTIEPRFQGWLLAKAQEVQSPPPLPQQGGEQCGNMPELPQPFQTVYLPGEKLGDDGEDVDCYSPNQMRDYGLKCRAAALPQVGEAKVVAPEGWKLVPKQPTREMIVEAWREATGKCDNETIRRMYCVMLDAALNPPVSRGNAAPVAQALLVAAEKGEK
jgi:hypothetical protein